MSRQRNHWVGNVSATEIGLEGVEALILSKTGGLDLGPFSHPFTPHRHHLVGQQFTTEMRYLLPLEDLQVGLALRVGVRIRESEVVDIVLPVEPERQGQDRVVPVVGRSVVVDVFVGHSCPETYRTASSLFLRTGVHEILFLLTKYCNFQHCNLENYSESTLTKTTDTQVYQPALLPTSDPCEKAPSPGNLSSVLKHTGLRVLCFYELEYTKSCSS
ncbi:hypothetical protein J6590_045385 [Homalodisca vitripennis]|nr:hypothetical protein J6590_045385 [Homalodisca vitripennis]